MASSSQDQFEAADAVLNEIFLQEDSDHEEFLGFSDSDSESENGDVVEEDEFDFQWAAGEPANIQKPAFTGNSGFNVPLTDTTYLGFYQLFVNDEDYADMARETNRYAASYFEKNPREQLPQKGRLVSWKEVSADEVKAFIAMTFAMGLIDMDDLKDYWSTHPVMSHPFFPKIMSRDRFMNILSFYHLNDNSTFVPRGQEGHDPLHKLGGVYRRIVERFSSNWIPRCNVSIDEAMIPFRGQIHFRVYNKDKPHKYGMKAYELCDSSNGYCSQFELYVGKGIAEPSQYGKTYDLVMGMLEPFLNKGYTLFTDNYYTSPILFRKLLNADTLACGTLRLNRKGVPKDVAQVKLKTKGEKKVVHCGQLTLMKMLDRKVFSILTTAHSTQNVETGKINPVTHLATTTPECVHEYNKYMGAVDRSDQMVGYNCFQRRTLKWWKKCIFHMLNLCVVNAYILYKEWHEANVPQSSKPVPHRTFRRELVVQMIESCGPLPGSVRRKGRRSAETLLRLEGRHFIRRIHALGKKKNISRTCVVCNPAEVKRQTQLGQKRAKRPGKESVHECAQCLVALCITPCFELYHTRRDFIRAYSQVKGYAAAHDSQTEDDEDDED